MGTRTCRIKALRGLGVAPNLLVFSGSAVVLTPKCSGSSIRMHLVKPCLDLALAHLPDGCDDG